MRAKFIVSSLMQCGEGAWSVIMSPICDDTTEENKRFTKYTPSGKLEMLITNSSVIPQLEPGKIFFVDFTAE